MALRVMQVVRSDEGPEMNRIACFVLAGGLLLALAAVDPGQPWAGHRPATAAPIEAAPRRDKADDPIAKKLFRERILPALKDHCYECHSAKSDELKGNLRVDTRDGLRKGGDNGPAVVPGEVDKSFLLKAMSYREDDYKMPPRGKLDDDLLEDFQRWIKLGAPDDR